MRKGPPGLRPEPYHLGEETLCDLPVLVFPESGEHATIVIGRFPFTKKYDAYAQAVAYCALPDLMAALRKAVRVQETLITRERQLNDLNNEQFLHEIMSDASRPEIEREQAEVVLQGREALRKAENE